MRPVGAQPHPAAAGHPRGGDPEVGAHRDERLLHPADDDVGREETAEPRGGGLLGLAALAQTVVFIMSGSVALLADLIATEQFFLESLAMSIFDGIERSAAVCEKRRARRQRPVQQQKLGRRGLGGGQRQKAAGQIAGIGRVEAEHGAAFRVAPAILRQLGPGNKPPRPP